MQNTGTPRAYDVLIVGCGPAGAALANFLRRYGHRAAVFDRDEEVFFAPRATGLDDESMRIYQTLGIDGRLVDGEHVRQGDLWFQDRHGRVLASFDRMSLTEDLLSSENGHFKMHFFDQPSVERILREDFDEPGGADAYLGYEVVSVSDEGDHAELIARDVETGDEHSFRGSYLVGCDGGRSLVRRSMQVERIDLGYSEDYLVIDAIVDDEVYWRTRIRDGGAITVDPEHSGVVAKGVHRYVRFDCLRHPDVVGEKRETEEDYERVGREMIVARGYDLTKFRPVRFAPYTFYAGMPAEWRKGRLLLAGDAAHRTPPWAGQGFNMCMRDAANLSLKLHLVLAGKASEDVIDSYPSERQPDSLRRITGAVATGRLMQTRSPLRRFARRLWFFAMRHSRLVCQAVFRAGQRKLPYRKGLVGSNHRVAGTIMPQPEVATVRGARQRFDDMIGLRFALVTAGRPTGEHVERFVRELDGAVFKLGPDFRDPTGELMAWFRRHGASTVLLRPDRYIYDAGNDADRLCRSLLESLRAPSRKPIPTRSPNIQRGENHMPGRIEQVEKYTHALNGRDLESAFSVMAEEFSLTDPFVDGLSPKAAVEDYYRASFSNAGLSAAFELTRVVENGNLVFAELDTVIGDQVFKGCNVFEFDGDRLVALRAYANGLHAMAAE